MKLRTKLLASVSALALMTGTLSACDGNDEQTNTTVVVPADETNTAVAANELENTAANNTTAE